MVALVLLFVSNNGLNAIRTELSNLDFSTNIERYTNRLILEEQKYRLNTNGSVYNLAVANQAYDNALDYVDKIYQTLNKTDGLNDSSFLLENSQKTRRSTNEYKNLYTQGVSILNELNRQATILASENVRNWMPAVESGRVKTHLPVYS